MSHDAFIAEFTLGQDDYRATAGAVRGAFPKKLRMRFNYLFWGVCFFAVMGVVRFLRFGLADPLLWVSALFVSTTVISLTVVVLRRHTGLTEVMADDRGIKITVCNGSLFKPWPALSSVIDVPTHFAVTYASRFGPWQHYLPIPKSGFADTHAAEGFLRLSRSRVGG